MNVKFVGKFYSVFFILLLTGCASIPPEAPALSTELGNRLSAIEKSNLTLLHRFFDQKRKVVDQFIEDEWVPEFATIFFSKPKIAEAWQTIVTERDKKQRLMFIVKVGPKIQEMINKKRLEMIQPLDDLERRIEKEIREGYLQARAINNSITSFLFSASKVAENRNRYLEKAGVTDNKVKDAIDRTDEAISDLLKGKIGSTKDYLKSIRNIRDSV